MRLYKITVSILVLFFTILWVALYSVSLTNYKPIILLRDFYYSKITPFIFSDKFVKATGLVPQNFRLYDMPSNKEYSYYFVGRFERFDFENNFIYVRSNFGKEYKFWYKFSDFDSNKNFIRFVLYERSGMYDTKPEKNVYLISKDNTKNSVNSFVKNDIIRIYWNDNKVLSKSLEFVGTEYMTITGFNKIVFE